jgi:hypothetical protein
MFKTKFILFFIFSFLFSQDFNPQTGELIKKKFNPKTGELVESSKDIKKSEVKLKNSKKNNKREEKKVQNTKANLKKNQVNIIKESSDIENDFNKIYFEETMYIKTGFWLNGFEKNGRKISKVNAYKELVKYTDSRNVYDQARLKLIYSALGAGILILGPYLGNFADEDAVSFGIFLGGAFMMVYNSILSINLHHKAVWVYNREALKANLKIKFE